MKTLRKAAQIALDALHLWHWTKETTGLDAAHDALRDALADQSEQTLEMVKPVAWMVYTLDGTSAFVTDNPKDFTDTHRALPLYTTPPQRKPLTDEEIDAIALELWDSVFLIPDGFHQCARAIEQAHGIGGEV